MAAFSPPKSLRPAQPPAPHRRGNSLSMGVPSGAAYQNGSADLKYPRQSPAKLATADPAWAAPRPRRSEDSDDVDYAHYDHDDDEDADDGRTPTASGAPRSAAYPVYSGADGDEETGGEVLISHGRYEEAHLRELDSKEKGKAKKLFGFATSSNNKKAKQDRDRATAPSPAPRASRDRDDVRLMSPPMDSRSLSAQERSKEGGWMDRWNKRAHQQQAARTQDKEAEEIVASRIGWLCANAYDEHDWMQILPLIDMVSHSEAASKEAARALRKEFKYGTVDTQRRAVRVWALLTLNGSDRFRLQIASKRFLEAIEDTVASSKTPLSVKETMLRVLGVLAFEFRSDAELVSVTKCWNKVKPNDRPKDGEPLENDLFEFRLPQPRASAQQQQQQQPSSRRVSQRRSQPPRQGAALNETGFDAPLHPMQHQQPLNARAQPPQPPILASLQPQAQPPLRQQHPQQQWSRPNLSPPEPTPYPRTAAFTTPPSMPIDHTTNGSNAPADIVSNLEAAAASMDSHSASYHSSADSSFTPHDVVTFDEDVRRLHEECQIARSNAAVLLDTLLHEGLHPDTVDLVDEFYSKVVRSQELIASQIGWASAQADRSRIAASGAERETREEALLADLLEAHGRTSEAVRVVDDARRRIEEEEAERRVTERSKVEVRLDRSALVLGGDGEVYDVGRDRVGGLLGAEGAHASGSRSPSPNAAAVRGATVLSPNLAFSPPTNGLSGAPPRISRPLPVPRSDQSSDSNSTHSFPPPLAANSLTASIHSTHSATTSSHSPNSHLAQGRSPLPLTPTLNIDTAQQQGEGQEEGEDELQTPVVPSAKALGKRRDRKSVV